MAVLGVLAGRPFPLRLTAASAELEQRRAEHRVGSVTIAVPLAKVVPAGAQGVSTPVASGRLEGDAALRHAFIAAAAN